MNLIGSFDLRCSCEPSPALTIVHSHLLERNSAEPGFGFLNFNHINISLTRCYLLYQ